MGLIKEFRDFAMKGNVVDMAVGIIIGAAFGKIVSSLVDNVLMPPLGWAMGKVDFSNLAFRLPVPDGSAVEIRYGTFLNTVISFLIVAFALFMVIKGVNQLRRAPTEPPKPTNEEALLVQIRDLLARK